MCESCCHQVGLLVSVLYPDTTFLLCQDCAAISGIEGLVTS